MRCVELGAGVGLVGLALAAMGARATVTDVRKVLPLLRRNLAANGFDPADGKGCVGACCAVQCSMVRCGAVGGCKAGGFSAALSLIHHMAPLASPSPSLPPPPPPHASFPPMQRTHTRLHAGHGKARAGRRLQSWSGGGRGGWRSRCGPWPMPAGEAGAWTWWWLPTAATSTRTGPAPAPPPLCRPALRCAAPPRAASWPLSGGHQRQVATGGAGEVVHRGCCWACIAAQHIRCVLFCPLCCLNKWCCWRCLLLPGAAAAAGAGLPDRGGPEAVPGGAAGAAVARAPAPAARVRRHLGAHAVTPAPPGAALAAPPPLTCI